MLMGTWHIGVRENDLDVSPTWIAVQSVVDVVLQTIRQASHEGGAGRDAVRVEVGAALFLWR